MQNKIKHKCLMNSVVQVHHSQFKDQINYIQIVISCSIVILFWLLPSAVVITAKEFAQKIWQLLYECPTWARTGIPWITSEF